MMSNGDGTANEHSIQLIDTVFPGTRTITARCLVGRPWPHMDKMAFLAATRHGRAPFITASSEKIDFIAPARIGDLIIATARVERVGRSSLDVAVELVAEGMTSAERRLCTQGQFTLVAVKGPDTRLPLPAGVSTGASQDDKLQMVDMIFPPQTNHYGTLYGGEALKMMGKAAFIAATRYSRAVIVMAASDRIDFRSPIKTGEMIESISVISRTGRSSINVSVELWAENLLSGQRRHAATADFTMVSVDEHGRAKPLPATSRSRRRKYLTGCRCAIPASHTSRLGRTIETAGAFPLKWKFGEAALTSGRGRMRLDTGGRHHLTVPQSWWSHSKSARGLSLLCIGGWHKGGNTMFSVAAVTIAVGASITRQGLPHANSTRARPGRYAIPSAVAGRPASFPSWAGGHAIHG